MSTPLSLSIEIHEIESRPPSAKRYLENGEEELMTESEFAPLWLEWVEVDQHLNALHARVAVHHGAGQPKQKSFLSPKFRRDGTGDMTRTLAMSALQTMMDQAILGIC